MSSPLFRTLALPTALMVLALAACDEPADRKMHLAAAPAAASTEPSAAASKAPHEKSGQISWDAAKGALVYNGQPLRAEKLWTFDGTTDGFTMAAGDETPAEGSGLAVKENLPDSQLLTPRGLNINGHTRSLVVVRLTRVRASPPFDGTVYYTTATHGVSEAFHARPIVGGDPAVGETMILVYDMHQLAAGGLDWRNSTIDRLRIDLDDGAGGAFIVHQVAIALDPRSVPLAPPPKGLKPAVTP